MTVPPLAFDAAYESLSKTVLGSDPEFRSKVAQQIVQTLAKLRAERGLAWLKKIGNGPIIYNQVVEASLEFGPNADLMTGRLPMEDAYIAAAKQFIAAYSRKK